MFFSQLFGATDASAEGIVARGKERAMHKPLLACLLVVGLWPTASEAQSEREWQRLYCRGMDLDVHLATGGEVDCLSAEHAIEVEWTKHWAEAVGQSLYYAGDTGRKPGIILLCESTGYDDAEGLCRSHIYRLEIALKFVNSHVELWHCFVMSDASLDACQHLEIQSVADKDLPVQPATSIRVGPAQ
jgi:hypothetical protein